MTTCRRGDVVLLPFPFSNQSAAKRRPAVVISSDDHNSFAPDVIVSAITSRVEGLASLGENLLVDWQTAGLIKPSALKAAISSIEQRMIIKKLGRLSLRDLKVLDEGLRELLAL
jgi:mRNA interferase MazF